MRDPRSNALGSFALTVTVARAVNYVREQRRPVLPFLSPRGGDDLRIHHFAPGIAIAFGTVALAARALVRGERSNENAGVAATGPQGSGRQATST